MYVGLLKQISEGGTGLIRDLLDVNAFEDQSRKLQPVQVNVHDLLTSSVRTYYSEAQAKGLILNVDSAPSLFTYTDSSYLKRIVDNLLSNAIKFSEREKTIMLIASEEDNYTVIKIKDEGPGFTSEDRSRLFKKFTTLSAQPTGGETSNGLGLAIVKNLMDKIGGAIELRSTPGSGSEFVLKLPTTKKEPASANFSNMQ